MDLELQACRLRWRAVAFALVALLLPGLASAQGLGDAAARERARRREAPKQPAKVYDNGDLPGQGTGKAPAATQDAAKPSANPAAEAEEPTQQEDDGAHRRARVAEAQKQLAEAEGRVTALQAHIQQLKDQLNPMSPSFVLGAATAGMAAPGAELRVRDELRQAEAELTEAQRAVDEARKALDAARATATARE